MAALNVVKCTHCGRLTPTKHGECIYCQVSLTNRSSSRARSRRPGEPGHEEPRVLGNNRKRFTRRSDDRQHFLVAETREPIELTPGQLFVIGRDPRASLVAHSPEVSRQHCEIDWDDHDPPRPLICEVRSSNGTFLNGKLITRDAPQPLRSGDDIRLGEQFTIIYLHVAERDLIKELEERGHNETRRFTPDDLAQLQPPPGFPQAVSLDAPPAPAPTPLGSSSSVDALDAMSGGLGGDLPPEGSLASLGGEALLRRLHQERHSGVLTIFDGQHTGELVLDGGRCVDATFAHLTGRQALMHVASMRTGMYRFHAGGGALKPPAPPPVAPPRAAPPRTTRAPAPPPGHPGARATAARPPLRGPGVPLQRTMPTGMGRPPVRGPGPGTAAQRRLGAPPPPPPPPPPAPAAIQGPPPIHPVPLEGSLSEIVGEELLRRLGEARSSGVLTVIDGRNSGQIVIIDGECDRARLGPYRDEEALILLSNMRRGSYLFRPDPGPQNQPATYHAGGSGAHVRPPSAAAPRPVPSEAAYRPPSEPAYRPPSEAAYRPPSEAAPRPVPSEAAYRPPSEPAYRPPSEAALRPPNEVPLRPPSGAALRPPASGEPFFPTPTPSAALRRPRAVTPDDRIVPLRKPTARPTSGGNSRATLRHRLQDARDEEPPQPLRASGPRRRPPPLPPTR